MSTDSSTFGSRAQHCIDNKTKPPGSLGQLESLAVQLSVIKHSLKPVVDPCRILVFAADHGIANEGVSAYPTDVTAQMMHNFAAGGAAVCVLSASAGAQLEVIDVGVAADLSELVNVVPSKVADGTVNFAKAPAMTAQQCQQAMKAGAMRVTRAVGDGVECIGLGEMGIGNTTSASVLLGVLRGQMVFAHASAEAAHQLGLQALSAKPLLKLGMRLGEGSAAALAFPLLRSAAAVMRDMASFTDAGVSTAE